MQTLQTPHILRATPHACFSILMEFGLNSLENSEQKA